MTAELIQKLKLEKYETIHSEDPHAFDDKLPPYNASYPVDLRIVYIKDLEEMLVAILESDSKNLIKEKGSLMLVYPKLQNKIQLEGIHRDAIFPYCHVSDETGIVEGTQLQFTQMLSYDDNFTMIRLKNIKGLKKTRTAPSDQRVALYEDRIGELEALLRRDTFALKFFKELPKGMQKDWTRHVLSAKREETQNKRLQSMIQGFHNGIRSTNN